MSTERATAIGEFLLGTCRSMADACETAGHCREDELSFGELTAIDEIAMQCEVCGWYVEPSELDLAHTCQDCRE